jgi:hypothetical protein
MCPTECDYENLNLRRPRPIRVDERWIRIYIHTHTRWFKYDRDDLCVNKSQFVPVIFEPPCICSKYINRFLRAKNAMQLKVQLLLCIPWRRMGMWVQLHAFLTSMPDEGEWISPLPSPFTADESYAMNTTLRRPYTKPAWSGGEKSLALSGIRTAISQWLRR